MRRSAYSLVALMVLASLLVVGTAPVGASIDPDGVYIPTARAEEPGDDEADNARSKKKQKPEPCPTELWNIAVPIEGLACLLLLPKSEKDEGEEEDRGGGLLR